MIQINGFKVVEPGEPVIGKVVEMNLNNNEGVDLFIIQEYFVNEYSTYLNRKIDSFTMVVSEKADENWKEFKKQLRKRTIKKEKMYIDVSVVNFLNRV